MILLTSAAGKTGRSILNNLSVRGVGVRAFVRTPQQAEEISRTCNAEVVIGDLRDELALSEACKGVKRIYFICPNMATDELEIGKKLIEIAKTNNVDRFVYHSVLHPQIEAMPHHWQKMRMEESLFTSGLDYTILQPCAYMQNILQGWNTILKEGQYIVPYSIEARISMVDLEDVGQAATNVLTQLTHSNAIYELAGPERLSQTEVAQQLSEILGRSVAALEQSRADWVQNARLNNMREPQIDLLLKMFEYYDKFGLVGNPSVLEFLLNRRPTNFNRFITRFTTSKGG